MDTFNLPSPGKINLFLHINGRRNDGYHNLQTIYQLIDVADILTFSPRQDHEVTLETDLPGVPRDQNLVMRAARLLQKYDKRRRGISITINKKLPIGGGLGGGSSNAATTLVGLNHYWQLGLSLEQLLTLGRQLGADVPVFILGQSCWAEALGDQMTPIEIPAARYIILTPRVHVSTVEIFCDKQLKRDTPLVPISIEWAKKGGNDCQDVTFKHYPKVKEAFDWLSEYGEVRMTGTGSSLFMPCSDTMDAQKIMAAAPPGYEIFYAQGLNVSPLLTSLHATR